MHIFHKWKHIERKKNNLKSERGYKVSEITCIYKCKICNKLKTDKYKRYFEIVKESLTQTHDGLKIKEFYLWKSGDSHEGQAKRRIRKVMNAAIEWINEKNINVINIQEDYYCGGRWSEEERGSTVTIFYK